LLEPPVSHPAPGVRGVAVRWFGQSGGSRREPSRRLSADPARAAVKLAGQAMIHLQSPDAGWDESPLFRRLPAWTVVPPRRPSPATRSARSRETGPLFGQMSGWPPDASPCPQTP